MPIQQGLPSPNFPMVQPPGQPTGPWYQFFVSLYTAVLGAGASGIFNTADLKAIATNTIPSGWLLCNGQAVSRSIYSTLYGEIGTTWGPGDGLTSFNVPDLRGMAPIGASIAHPLGATGGAESATIAVANLPSHTHAVTDPGHIHTSPTHTHTIPTGTVGGAGAYAANVNPATVPVTGATAATVDNAATGLTVGNTGGGVALDTISPFAAVNWLIKT